jgi:hypothetical protein
MSKRTAFALLVVLAAGAAFAAMPGARYETRMVYDSKIQRTVMFGGLTALDAGTSKAYDLGDTWEWNGQKWILRYTPAAPPARSSHVMVWDSNRQQTLLFGGKYGGVYVGTTTTSPTYLNDTWKYTNGTWSKIDTPNSPPRRVIHGGAFDPIRDRFIVYGGTTIDSAGKTSALRDTWEFDGTTWTQNGDNGPDVAKPILVYDKARNKVLMLAEDAAVAAHMYSYDAGAKSWTELKPTTLPPCVNEGMMVYDSTRNVVVYTGGTCVSSGLLEETYEWNGDNWTKVTLNSLAGRVFGGAMAYDEGHQKTVLFGGYYSSGPRNGTYLYFNKGWESTSDGQPSPRSLAVFAPDMVNKTVWLYGGVSSGTQLRDFWKYQNGHFDAVTADGAPTSCAGANGGWDSDRQKLVIYCAALATLYEYDPAKNAWATFSPKHVPQPRSFTSFVYDPHLKQSVLFGGWDGTNFRDDTWTWNGTDWTQVSKNPPPSRELASVWYDPTLQRTVIYGGLGRLTSTDRITRYGDMWQFDGTGWTEIKPANVPGTRFGAKVAVDPRNGHALLFGGLLMTGTEPNQVQSYAGDMWEWNGTNWSQLTTDGNPPARENTAFAFDPNRNELVMFAGYGGYYLSDIWSLTNGNKTWRPWVDTSLRRRSAGK